MRELDRDPASVAILRARTGLGDLLCSVPALRALRARLPSAHVALITFPEMAAVVERQRSYVDELLPFPGWPGIPERPPRRHELPAFLERCRQRNFDLAVQMYGGRPAAKEVVEQLGARRTAGFSMSHTRTEPAPDRFLRYPAHLHEIDRHLALMELLGAPSVGRQLEFPIGPQDEREAAAIRVRHDLGDYVLLHPGATSSSRRWRPAGFADVGDALAAHGLGIAVTGVAGEQRTTRAVASAMRSRAADLCGSTSLGGFAALLRDARLLVCSDTGAAHLAAATLTPAVVAFLSGDPVRWSHPGHRAARVPVGCNPCEHLDCPIDHRCAARLTAARVLADARALLAATPAETP